MPRPRSTRSSWPRRPDLSGSSTTTRTSGAPGSSASCHPATTAEDWATAAAIELGDAVDGRFERRDLAPDRLVVTRAARVSSLGGDAAIRADQGDPARRRQAARRPCTLTITVENRSSGTDRRDPRHRVDAHDAGRRRQPVRLVGGRWRAVRPRRAWRGRRRDGIRAGQRRTSASRSSTTVSEPADLWWAPVETVSNSEGGFERVYQGAGMLVSWPLRSPAGASTDRDRSGSARHRPPTGLAPRTSEPARPPCRRRPREPRPARRPRPLLPAVACGSVQRDVPADPSAAPAHDWTARVSAECYRPNAERGNLGRCRGTSARRSPAGWRAATRSPTAGSSPATRASTASPSRSTTRSCHSPRRPTAGRDPLGPARLRAAVRPAGDRDVAARDGGRPRHAPARWRRRGVRHTILAPWQAGEMHVETRRPYRVELGGGRSDRGRPVRRRAVDRGLVRPACDRRRRRVRAERIEPRHRLRHAPRRRAAARRDRHRR